MALNPQNLGKNYGTRSVKAAAVRIADAGASTTTDYAEIIVGDGPPSGGYGRASGASLMYLDKAADSGGWVPWVSHDGGTTWCDVLSSNKPGIAFVAGVFQRMRMVLRGFLDNPDLPTISVGVGAEECGPCPACELGDGESDVSLGGT